MIRFHNVVKSFSGTLVLNDVSFEIKPHETVALLGPSGSGKTTILRLIAGTLKPDSGTIEVESSRIGYVFQDHRLLPWRTALDNITLVLRATGLDITSAHEKAQSWMNLMKLRDFHHYYPGQLSGGMMQRVSLARAFAIEPEIMLMDEPFSSLDAGLTDSLLRQTRKILANYRTTTIYVTHDLVEALSIAERIFRIGPEGFEEIPVVDRQKLLDQHLKDRLKGILEI
jgi:NitT/TauT family transport system ATP-binding protein